MISTRSLIAIAIGVALAVPAMAQAGNGNAGAPVAAAAQAQVQTQAPVPNPIPTASPELGHGRSAQGATDNITSGAVQDAQAMQEEKTDAPMTAPVQSQGAEHAAANSSVVQRDLWDRLDADHDGMVSATEASVDAGFDGGFARMDVDGNGTVSQDEYGTYAKAALNTGGQNASAGSQASTRLTWNNVDTDKDGKLSTKEVQGYSNLKANFTAIDGNGDGFVTQDEYRSYAKTNRQPGKP
jgi:Ca2+-binding EF-hand superfamily protein